MRDRGDHYDLQVVDRGDGAQWDACGQHARGHGRIAEQVAQQIDGDSAVGDDRDGPWRGGQAGEEFLQVRVACRRPVPVSPGSPGNGSFSPCCMR